MTNAIPSAELRIPRPGRAIGMAIWYALVLLTISIALWNLLRVHQIPIASTIASVLWLGLVYLLISIPLRAEGNIRQYIIQRLRAFSGHHFARILSGEDGVTWLAMGYTLWGREYFYLQIETTAIYSVAWHAGQGSSMSGRDLNDWSVVMWYRDANGPARKCYPGPCKDDALTMVLEGSRAEVTAFGQQLVKFLIESGVSLSPGRREGEFLTPERRAALQLAKVPPP